jgi:hypothetical protein
MLLIFLQLGLIILVVLLFSLVAFSCKPKLSNKSYSQQSVTLNNTKCLNQKFTTITQQYRNTLKMSSFEKKLIQAQKSSIQTSQQYSFAKEKNSLENKKA